MVVSQRACVLALAVALTGCGARAGQPGPASPEPEADPPTERAAPEGWEALDRDGRLALMREAVMPRMGEAFRAFDEERFTSFVCSTCHGADHHDVDYRMPNGLSPLAREAIPGLVESDDERVASTARFMFGQVTPTMVEILGVAPFDHETGRGFGCLSCHAAAAP